MAEYIEREAFLAHIEDLPTWGMYGNELDRADVISSVENAPAADVVEVVRCKDCKSWDDGWLGYCTKCHTAIPRDGFCSYGEEKERKMRFLKNGNLKDKEIEEALREAADNYANGELMEVKGTLFDIIEAIEEWAESDY